ncbi:MAG: fumarylacetoacetate hydrolase family protein [Bacteroidales bacterium]|nr:fumarylacetoacetate hydrolase family protein [Bacteroidales bacterium]
MKIICIGMNYKAHIEELQLPTPKEPVFFLKPDSAILRSNKDFYIPDWTSDLQYELEVVYRINRLGKYIQKKFAHRYYDAIGLGLDLTARDLQEKCRSNGLPWEICKAFDGSAVISEFVPVENIADRENISFSLLKNDELVQKGNTSDVLFGIDDIIEHVSKYMTLKIGDLIFTGTPIGVGRLQIGDKLKAYMGDELMIDMKIK